MQPNTVHRECREALQLTQAELAQLAGVTQPLVSHLETNLSWKLLGAMRPLLVERVQQSCAEGQPDAAALRALARLTEATGADSKR